MFSDKYAFSQLIEFIHLEQFQRYVRRYEGNYKIKSFSCWDQFLCMAFGQLTFRDSLGDIETCLRSRQDQLYHLGIRGRVSHSTMADAHQNRESRPVEPSSVVRSDQIVRLRNHSSIKRYPDKLRRIHYVDEESDKHLVFLTNHLDLPATVVAMLYKSR